MGHKAYFILIPGLSCGGAVNIILCVADWNYIYSDHSPWLGFFPLSPQ